MSHLRVKTKYAEEAAYAGTDYVMLYCHHNFTSDCVVFYDYEFGVQSMFFGSWQPGNDLKDAMDRLWYPFKDKWGGELKDGVEYWDAEDYEKYEHRI